MTESIQTRAHVGLRNTIMEVQSTKPVVTSIATSADHMIDLERCETVAAALGCQIDWRNDATDQQRLHSQSTVFAAATDRAENMIADMATRAGDTHAFENAVVFTLFSAPRKSQPVNVLLASPVSGNAAALERHRGDIQAQIAKTASDHHRRKICFLKDDRGFETFDLSPSPKDIEALPGGCDIETLHEEEGFAALLRNPNRWDMIICRPSIRRLLSTLFIDRAQLGTVAPYWVLSPTDKIFGLENHASRASSSPTILAQVQALGALLADLGLKFAQRHLEDALNDVLGRGVSIEGLFDTNLFGATLSEEEFTQTLLETIGDQAQPGAAQTIPHMQKPDAFSGRQKLALVQ